MGSAMTRWSIVDNNLTVIYGVAVNPRKPTMAAASIWPATGHSLKVEMIETALESAFIEYPKGDAEPVREAWNKAKKLMKKAVKGRNDLGHSAIYGVQKKNGRMSALQKDREKFHALREGSTDARYFDVAFRENVESDCFDAAIAVIRILQPLDEFFRASRIVMQETEAYSTAPFSDPKWLSRLRYDRVKSKR